MKGMFSQGMRMNMRKVTTGLFGLILGSLQLSQTASAEDVGAIAGEFSVSSGTATYSIPIQMPQGVAGMQPEVSLNYSSQGGNGLLGLGWSLGGLTTIHRCPATIAQDGVRGSVNLDEHDKFCMDGQRLIAVTGAYGDVGTEYRTEIDSFAKITSVGGTLSAGPNSWEVKTKSGQTIELGNTADSKRLSSDLVKIYWQVNSIKDAVGNEITYTYYNQADEHYPTRIDYSGNSIQFEYDPEPRPDIVTTYSNGVKTVM
ncbi:MAG: hypothetical protein KZQ75_05325 [Candidatus Thiodiazotropha sp. (ex Myrtea spinifera)]|nr:hypothetical protein [Candidatus Thiodiazotropha sp. (ex Myrtea spinifera)]